MEVCWKKSWSIEELWRLLDIPESYPMREIDKRVLTPIETELSPIFKGLSINKEKKGRGGKVTAIEFTSNRKQYLKNFFIQKM